MFFRINIRRFCCDILASSALLSQARAPASKRASCSLEIVCLAAITDDAETTSPLPTDLSTSFCRSWTNSTQTAVLTLASSNIRASIHANKSTPIEAGPDVAAAQTEVPSTPTELSNGPSSLDLLGLTPGASTISDARHPYALRSFGVDGITCSKSAPTFLAS